MTETTENQNIEITLERSVDLASHINGIKTHLHEVDVPYARAAAREMARVADSQDSTAALNRSYDPQASDLLRLQADALDKLADFIDQLRAIDEMKNTMHSREAKQMRIVNFFL